MDSDDFGSQIELNATNQNDQGLVVLNDQRLLELLHMYPYLFSKQVRPQQDADYDEWGWEQITSEFNRSYENLSLGSPFSVEELQWRWDILRPLMGTLSKTSNKLPAGLSSILKRVNHMLNAEKPHNTKPPSSIEKFLLDQLPYVERLSEMQRRRLEVEIIDTILRTEMRLKAPIASGTITENEVVQNEYDAFLKDIRVKELPADTFNRLSGSEIPIFVATKPSSASSTTISPDPVNRNVVDIVNNKNTNLVISNVCTAKQSSSIAPKPEFPASKPMPPPPPPPAACIIKIEPPDVADIMPQLATTPVTEICIKPDLPPMQYIPIKSAKYYVKKVRVMVKRLNLTDYMPLAKIRRRRK